MFTWRMDKVSSANTCALLLSGRRSFASAERGPRRRCLGPGFDASPSVSSGAGAKQKVR